MTRMIKISTLVAVILLMSGMLFKTQHWMGANVIFIAGVAAAVISSIFIISSFTGKLTSGLEKINIIFASLTIAIVFLAFLFKVLHWPGAAKLIWASDIAIVLSTVLFLADGLKEKDQLKSTLKFIAMFFLLFLFMLIMMMSK